MLERRTNVFPFLDILLAMIKCGKIAILPTFAPHHYTTKGAISQVL
jgi:hypothetical protein